MNRGTMITYIKKIKDTSYSNILDFKTFSLEGLYIDIETTGFNRQTDMIYLVGLMYIENNELMLTQYLCEKTSDEYELLFRLNMLVTNYNCLIHFNGNRFDLPFIKARMAMYSIHENLSDLVSIDFYTLLRPFKRLLQTDNLKLSSLEALASYVRIDQFNGGDLIALYKLYLDGDKNLMYSFILHNEEDMIGLYYMNRFVPMLYYTLKEDMANNFPIIYKESDIEFIKNSDRFLINIPFKSTMNIYSVSHSDNENAFSINTSGLLLSLPIETNTKKLFFENYKEYYYLEEEDYAIHQSVASFMSKSHRKKATRDTAYIKKEDTFIKCPLKKKKVTTLLNSKNINNEYIFENVQKSNYCFLTLDTMKTHILLLLPNLIQEFL